MATLPNMALKTIIQFKSTEKWKYHAFFFFFPLQLHITVTHFYHQ